ncbi:hypothetical protein PsorP6_012689 [Peronosclerospora sorghi]|uniref:Uncharacterized protein n=1 Tax=Peronosclerospora sorghi TaxID=230839 RepID=A0ACC0WGR8_9STRA|nr:hypothetical protein PsorP6_012689 [Peronosclerospora sorghi]
MTSDGEVHIVSSFRPIFWCLAGSSMILLYFSMGNAKKDATIAAFLLTPFICICLICDNIIMATTGLDRRRASTQVMLAFHACIMPMMLLVCYELAYLVHRDKGVNFCGITFERGRGKSSTVTSRRSSCLSTGLRLFVWLTGCVLLVLNLLVAYHWTSNLSPEVTSLYELQGDSVAHVLSAILPAVFLVSLALYVGLRLWNYGTNYSYLVHATCWNPWIWMLVGALALLIGYVMPSPIYALSSNAGEVLMMATIVRMFREVRRDREQGLQLGQFIGTTAQPSQYPCKTLGEQAHGYMVVTTPTLCELPSSTLANQIRRHDQLDQASNLPHIYPSSGRNHR